MGALIIKHDFEVGRPPSAVFDYLADASHWQDIDPAVVEVAPSGPLRPGSTGTVTHRRRGMKVETAWTATVLEPGERLEVLITGFGYALRETVDLAAAGDRTTVTVTDAVEPTSLLGKLLVAVSGRTIRKDLDDRSRRLQAVLESHDRQAADKLAG